MTDIRLVAPALAAWAACGSVLLGLSGIPDLAQRHTFATTICFAALAIVAGAMLIARQRPTAFVIAAASALAIFSAAVQVQAWTSPPVSEWMGKQGDLRGEVDGPLRTALGVAYLPMRTTHIGDDERAWRVSVPITVTIPEHRLTEFIRDTSTSNPWAVGTAIEVSGRLRPAGGSVRTAGYLDLSDPAAITITRQPGTIDRTAETMRRALHGSLPMTPAGGSALVAGLAIGDEEAMSPGLVDDMRGSGLAHLTAVSGGNVAIVVGAVIALAWLIRLPLLVRVLLALGSLGFYVVLVHPQPSVLRAGVMGGVVVVSLLIGGRRPGPAVLATAILVLVITVPSLTLSWGFALSVAATAGIVMLAPAIRERIERTRWGERLPAAVSIAASLTLSAQLATAPVLIAMGVSVGIVAVPANLLAMPVVPIVTIAGLLAAVLGAFPQFGPLADGAALIGAWTGEWIAMIARVAGGVDVLRIQGSPLFAIIAVVGAGMTVAAWRRGLRTGVLVVGSVLTCAAMLWAVFPPSARSWPPANWVMVQCDVGQGDGLVIDTEAGAVVIDAGPDSRGIERCLRDLHVEHIAVLILTHFHADHVSGIDAVLSARRVDAVFATPLDEPPAQAMGVQRILRDRGLQLQRLTARARIDAGEGTFEVLWPRRIINSRGTSSGSVANNASVVIDARIRGLRLLLTGDIEPPAQAAILAEPGGFDVAKIPHHGSRHQHPDFPRWADAQVAIVSVGADNDFSHPARETIDAWEQSGARIARTDLHGDVAVVIDEPTPSAESMDPTWGIVPRTGSIE